VRGDADESAREGEQGEGRAGRDEREGRRRRGGRGRREFAEGGVQGMLPMEEAEPPQPVAEEPVAEASAGAAPSPAPAIVPDATSGSVPQPRAAAQPIRIEPYELPAADLAAVASAAGLQWVSSDADKVAAVQAAMAAEPRPVHVPREPRPPVVIDEGPLVLVETRKDLSQVRLPFEAPN
jgi:ribonuclease E